MSDVKITLVDLGKLSKPATALIEKVSAAVGGLAEPWQMERTAKAKAKVDLIQANSEVVITDLHRRAARRWIDEEACRQENMEQIIRKALPQLEDGAEPGKIEDDWVTNFFDKSRIISDDDMQNFWSRILAGEANSPGSYAKRTVNFLGGMDKRDAELFQALCGFIWKINGDPCPLIYDNSAAIYNDKGINFDALTHLDSIGLVQYYDFNYGKIGLQKEFTVSYCNRYSFTLTMKKRKNNKINVGKVLLTQTGKELSRTCDAQEVDGFVDYVKGIWKEYLPPTWHVFLTISKYRKKIK